MKADEIFSWIATILGFGLKSSPIVLFYKIALGKETIEIVDIAGLVKGASKGEGLANYLQCFMCRAMV